MSYIKVSTQAETKGRRQSEGRRQSLARRLSHAVRRQSVRRQSERRLSERPPEDVIWDSLVDEILSKDFDRLLECINDVVAILNQPDVQFYIKDAGRGLVKALSNAVTFYNEKENDVFLTDVAAVLVAVAVQATAAQQVQRLQRYKINLVEFSRVKDECRGFQDRIGILLKHSTSGHDLKKHVDWIVDDCDYYMNRMVTLAYDLLQVEKHKRTLEAAKESGGNVVGVGLLFVSGTTLNPLDPGSGLASIEKSNEFAGQPDSKKRELLYFLHQCEKMLEEYNEIKKTYNLTITADNE